MKLEKVFEVESAARAWANATETGCRQVTRKIEDMTQTYIRQNCKQTKKSRYILYTRTDNLDKSRRHADWCKRWNYTELHNYRETEKMLVSKIGNHRIHKDNIIGYAD